MAENTDWFQGLATEQSRRGDEAGGADVKQSPLLALLGAGALSWW